MELAITKVLDYDKHHIIKTSTYIDGKGHEHQVRHPFQICVKNGEDLIPVDGPEPYIDNVYRDLFQLLRRMGAVLADDIYNDDTLRRAVKAQKHLAEKLDIISEMIDPETGIFCGPYAGNKDELITVVGMINTAVPIGLKHLRTHDIYDTAVNDSRYGVMFSCSIQTDSAFKVLKQICRMLRKTYKGQNQKLNKIINPEQYV